MMVSVTTSVFCLCFIVQFDYGFGARLPHLCQCGIFSIAHLPFCSLLDSFVVVIFILILCHYGVEFTAKRMNNVFLVEIQRQNCL